MVAEPLPPPPPSPPAPTPPLQAPATTPAAASRPSPPLPSTPPLQAPSPPLPSTPPLHAPSPLPTPAKHSLRPASNALMCHAIRQHLRVSNPEMCIRLPVTPFDYESELDLVPLSELPLLVPLPLPTIHTTSTTISTTTSPAKYRRMVYKASSCRPKTSVAVRRSFGTKQQIASAQLPENLDIETGMLITENLIALMATGAFDEEGLAEAMHDAFHHPY
eukprot:5055992-Amphidinium_carterae.1